MLLNNKGFSLLEIMAVLVITTVLIVPLLSGLSDSYSANQRAQHRSNAVSVAEGAVNSIEKIDFASYSELLTLAKNNGDSYYELNIDTCSEFSDLPVNGSDLNAALCSQIFGIVWNSQTYTAETFKIFIYDYKLENIEWIFGGTKNTNGIILADGESNVDTLIRVVVWVEYYINPSKSVTFEGMLVSE